MYAGKLVRLRALRMEDAQTFTRWMNDETLSRKLSGGGKMPMMLEEEEDWIRQNARPRADEGNFAVETLEGQLIGSCGYRNVVWKDRTCIVGWSIGNAQLRNQGYGTDMIKTLLRYLFNDLDLFKVSLEVFSFNEPAVRLYERLGFVREGTFREHVYALGRRWDTYRYAMRKSEWEAFQ